MTKDPVDRAIAEHHARVFAKHSVMSDLVFVSADFGRSDLPRYLRAERRMIF